MVFCAVLRVFLLRLPSLAGFVEVLLLVPLLFLLKLASSDIFTNSNIELDYMATGLLCFRLLESTEIKNILTPFVYCERDNMKVYQASHDRTITVQLEQLNKFKIKQ